MKKWIILTLALALLLCLCACGAKESASVEEAASSETLILTQDEAAPEEEAAAPEAPNASDSDSDMDLPSPIEDSSSNVVVAPQAAQAEESGMDQEMFNLATDRRGLGLDDLYAAVGEPDGGAEYSTSCLEDDAEDGTLYYNEYGFFVWTLRYANGDEIVKDVLEQ